MLCNTLPKILVSLFQDTLDNVECWQLCPTQEPVRVAGIAGKEASKCLRNWVSAADMSNLNDIFFNWHASVYTHYIFAIVKHVCNLSIAYIINTNNIDMFCCM